MARKRIVDCRVLDDVEQDSDSETEAFVAELSAECWSVSTMTSSTPHARSGSKPSLGLRQLSGSRRVPGCALDVWLRTA